MSRELRVRWTTGRPEGALADAPYVWNDSKGSKEAEESSEDVAVARREERLEAGLGWSRGTISILRAAFEARLSRFVPWDLSQITSERARRKYLQAAAVFRRGVPISGQRTPKSRGSYDVRVLDNLKPINRRLISSDFVLVDGNVERAWPHLEDYLHYKIQDISERAKSLETVGRILSAWRRHERPMKWVAVGGGLTTDLVGFAAAIVGAEVVMVPTTLLGMVDASIGGKTGVNFSPYGKNQVGSFKFPSEVMIWPGWLDTLLDRQIAAGGAECLKHCFLGRGRRELKRLVAALASRDLPRIAELLPDLLSVKAEVVDQDPNEDGMRMTLNLGHTMGHALEAVSHGNQDLTTPIEHGEAVGLGMAFAASLALRLGVMPESEHADIWGALRESRCLVDARELRHYLGVRQLGSEVLWKKIHAAIAQDKKNLRTAGSVVPFVLLRKIGKVYKPSPDRFVTEVEIDEIKSCWLAFVKELAADQS